MPINLYRRDFLKSLGLAATFLVLGGCGGESTPTTPTTPTTPSKTPTTENQGSPGGQVGGTPPTSENTPSSKKVFPFQAADYLIALDLFACWVTRSANSDSDYLCSALQIDNQSIQTLFLNMQDVTADYQNYRPFDLSNGFRPIPYFRS